MTPKIRAELSDSGVLTVTLADEAKRNVLSSQLVSEFVETVERAESDDAVRLVVVTNEGSVFCAGADLAERTAEVPAPPAADPGRIFRSVVGSAKPFVGRIAGHTIAGGIGLAAVMDISVALEDAKFGFTEVRLGLAPAIISVICLPKMRRADAADALLRGRRFDGREAARLGLVTQAVPESDLDDRVGEIVDDLLLGGPEALATTKKLLRTVPTLEFDAAHRWASSLSAERFASDEGQEGMRAYLEKRRPAWAADHD